MEVCISEVEGDGFLMCWSLREMCLGVFFWGGGILVGLVVRLYFVSGLFVCRREGYI